MSLKTMGFKIKANLSREQYLVLSYYADMKPHSMAAQFLLIKLVYRQMTTKKFREITKRFFVNGIIRPYGDDYYKVTLKHRSHVLTNKGDKLFREASVCKGGDEEHFTTFKRRHKV